MNKAVAILTVVAAMTITNEATFAEATQSKLDRMTANMFVPRGDDRYAPGIAIGETLPPLKARYQGREITQLNAFMGAKGMVIYVNRSVDW